MFGNYKGDPGEAESLTAIIEAEELAGNPRNDNDVEADANANAIFGESAHDDVKNFNKINKCKYIQ